MKRLWADTLFKRLFLLMWLALVASHLVAYLVVTQWGAGDGPHARAPTLANTPTLPSLPPMPGLPHVLRPPPPDGGPPPGPPELPARLLLLDYGVRFLIIGAAAWWGARWLAAPVRRLVAASHSLIATVGSNSPVPRLDERRGTLEVREAAQVFNHMARQLDEQFKGRGLMVAAISHDLRTPLTRVRMRLETLATEPAAQRCVADVHEMDSLIGSALEVFRGATHSEPMQNTDVSALVQSLCDDLVEQGHAASTRSGAPAIVAAQPVALRRALSNLMSNAVRHGERAEVEVLRDADGVKVIIDDTGPGIPQDQIEAVFQPFYRVDSSRSRQTGGSGLGLYIARDLLQRQHATLTLTNRPQGGLRAVVQIMSTTGRP